MKRLNFVAIPLIILFCFGSMIIGSKLTGYWATERSITPRLLAEGDTYDPYDIRGSYSIKEVLEYFNIPKEDFYTGLNIPSDTCGDTQLKELEKLTVSEDPTQHFGVSDVRDFVATFIGYVPPEPVASHEEEPSTLANADPIDLPTKDQNNSDTIKTATLGNKSNNSNASNISSNNTTQPTSTTTTTVFAQTSKPVAVSDSSEKTTPEVVTNQEKEVTSAQKTTVSNSGETTPVSDTNSNSQDISATKPTPAEHTETFTEPRGGTPLSQVYAWGVTQEMLEKRFNINFAEANLTPENTLKEMADAAGVSMSDVKAYVTAQMKK